MKRILLVSIIFALSVSGCNRDRSETSSIVEIRENMFLTQINDINLNYREYLGRIIKLEGFITRNNWNDRDYYFVIRNGPNCCGDDGDVGFEISWTTDMDGSGHPMDLRSTFPEENEWVQAIGELRSYDFMGYPFLYLALSELNVLQTRGLEYIFR